MRTYTARVRTQTFLYACICIRSERTNFGLFYYDVSKLLLSTRVNFMKNIFNLSGDRTQNCIFFTKLKAGVGWSISLS